MKVNELIERLQRISGDTEVMILDDFNGGGCPRTINFGPTKRTITQENSDDAADCEDRIGEEVIVIGYGNY